MKTACHLDYENVLAGRAEIVHLALAFTAEKQGAGRAKPFAFVLALDHSGSMEGQPLNYAKEAAGMVLKNLREDDRFAVVIFSESARTIIPLQAPLDKVGLQAAISRIAPGGSTNLTAGWMLGRDELAKAPSDMPRKILLLTDGLLNAGVVEPAQVRQIVGGGLEREGVRTSCLGFGESYQEDLLDELSKAGGGALHHAATPEKFPAIFRQELESLLALSTQNLRVRVRKLHYCSGLGVLSDYPVVALPEGGLEIAVGDLVSEEQRVLVLALEVLPIPPQPDGGPTASIAGEALLELEIAYDEITEEGISSKVEAHTVRLSAVQHPAEVKVNRQVVEWVAAQEVGRVMAAAMADCDRGDVEAVSRRVGETRERLEKYACEEGTGKALGELAAFEKDSQEWTAVRRKSSRTRSNRSLRTSSYYQNEEAAAPPPSLPAAPGDAAPPPAAP